MIIAGIDPSMNSSGVCKMTLGDNYEVLKIDFYAYNMTKKWCFCKENINIECVGTSFGKKLIYERIDIVNSFLEDWLVGVEHCSFEDFAYDKAGNGSGSILQLAEFIGAMRKKVHDMHIPIDRYSPTAVKVFATGTRTATKPMMMQAFEQKYPTLFNKLIFTDLKLDDSPQEDIVDSFWMAEVLRCRLAIEAKKPIDSALYLKMNTSSSKNTSALVESIREKPTES
jgi:Holliday junction resolvasome RuvABC endonuclease subunit